jgi:hypothetical protein
MVLYVERDHLNIMVEYMWPEMTWDCKLTELKLTGWTLRVLRPLEEQGWFMKTRSWQGYCQNSIKYVQRIDRYRTHVCCSQRCPPGCAEASINSLADNGAYFLACDFRWPIKGIYRGREDFLHPLQRIPCAYIARSKVLPTHYKYRFLRTKENAVTRWNMRGILGKTHIKSDFLFQRLVFLQIFWCWSQV